MSLVPSEVSRSAESLFDTFMAALPRIGVAVGITVVGWAISLVVRRLLHRALKRRQTPSFAQVMSRIAGWLVVALSAFVAAAVTFPSVKPVDLLAGLGFFSVAVGFAFRDILENSLAGVLMLFRQPFRSGDQIEVAGQSGTVREITIRETRIRTFDGQLVLVPNRDVYKSVIRVQTHFPLRRLEFMVGIAYENDAAEAIDMIVHAMSAVQEVADDPAPEALVSELGSSTVNIVARFWCVPRQHDALDTLSAAIVAVKSALDAAGIELPSDVVVLQAAPSFRAAVQGDEQVTPGGGIQH